MRECINCGKKIEPEISKSCEYCRKCNGERLWAEINAPREPAAVFKLRPGWSFKAETNKPLFEESLDYVHACVDFQGGKIELSIRKREGDNNEFIVAIADKLFIVGTELTNKDHRREHGVVLSEHGPFDLVDEA